jgi:hypothetical protein
MPMLWHFQQSAAAGRPNAAAERLRSAFAWARVLSFSKSSALQVKLVFHHGRGACAPKIIAGVKGGLVDPGFMASPHHKGLRASHRQPCLLDLPQQQRKAPYGFGVARPGPFARLILTALPG